MQRLAANNRGLLEALNRAYTEGGYQKAARVRADVAAQHANKQVVLHIVRDLLEANHWEPADRYLTKQYIQHNPNVASGLEPVLKCFGSRTPTPIPDRRSWKTQVVSVTAENDLVVVAFAREYPIPEIPARPTRPRGSTCGGSRMAKPTSTGIPPRSPLQRRPLAAKLPDAYPSPAAPGSRLRSAARHAHREACSPSLRCSACSLATESASLRETPAAAGSAAAKPRT